MVVHVTMVTFWMTLLKSEQILSCMMVDEFIHWPKPFFSCQQLAMKYGHG